VFSPNAHILANTPLKSAINYPPSTIHHHPASLLCLCRLSLPANPHPCYPAPGYSSTMVWCSTCYEYISTFHGDQALSRTAALPRRRLGDIRVPPFHHAAHPQLALGPDDSAERLLYFRWFDGPHRSGVGVAVRHLRLARLAVVPRSELAPVIPQRH
jgi:hypothetical protein